MPVCEVCDSETFESRDGLYYCLTCGTQSQDIRDEVVEEQTDFNRGLALNKRKGRRGRIPYARVSGKPWLIQEAFQIIIKKQVEFLIGLGADPKLKEIVGQLWFKYLHKTCVAFVDPKNRAKLSIPSKSGGVNMHNADVITPRKKKKKKKAPINDDLLELSSEMSAVINEESNSSNEEIDSDTSLSNLDCVSDRPLQSKSSKDINMRFTVALTYLGLLLLNEPIFLSDLIRWIRESHLPYCNAPNIMPSYMKLTKADNNILARTYLPLKHEIYSVCCYLIKLLDLSIPEQNLRKYTSKFILSLNLPAVMHGVVNNLLSTFKPGAKFYGINKNNAVQFRSLLFEETAMAYVFVAFKMCYGLGDFQNKLESHADENVSSEELHDSLPVLKDWLHASQQCHNKTTASGIPWNREDFGKLQDSTVYTKFCKEHLFGDWVARDREMTNGIKYSIFCAQKKYGRKEYRDKNAELFSAVAGDTEAHSFPISSFPGRCYHGNHSNHGNPTDKTNQDGCFSQTKSRRITLQALKQTRLQVIEEQCDKEGEASTSRDKCGFSYKVLLQSMAAQLECKTTLLEQTIERVEELCMLRD